MHEPINEITVIRAGALGDVVLTLPAVAVLRAAFPHACLRAVGYPANWGVAGPLVNDVRSIDSPSMAGLLTNAPSEPLRLALGSANLVVAWTSRDVTPGLQRLGLRRILHASPTPLPGMHAARWLLESLSEYLKGAFGIPMSAVSLSTWHIPYTETERLQASALLEKLQIAESVLMHPGAGAAWKRWPAARFAATGTALRNHGQSVALLGGPADDAVIAGVQSYVAQPFPVVPPMEARALGAVLSHAICYLGNDSGVTHLSGASGTPTVALFGPTDPAAWKPLGQTTVLRHCTAPTQLDAGIRVCDDPACLEAITVDEVVHAIEHAIVQNRVEICR